MSVQLRQHRNEGRLYFLRSYLGRHRGAFVIGAMALLARDGVAVTIPLLIRQAVNLLAEKGDEKRTAWIAAGMIVAATLKAGLQTLARLRMMKVSRDVEYEMRNDLFRHLMSLEPGFYSNMRTGDVMAHATNDLNSVRMMMGPGVVNALESMVTFPLAFAVMAGVDWRLTLVALAPFPIAVLLMSWFGREIRDRFGAIQGMFSHLSAVAQQHLSGIRTVRAFVQESAEVRRFSRLTRAYASANARLGIYASLSDPLLAFLIGLSMLVVLWYGGMEVLHARLSLGGFAMFMTYLGTLLRPVAALGRVVNLMQRGLASLTRLRALFAMRPAIRSPKQPVRAPTRLRGELRLENISVRYGRFDVLRSIDLSIQPGSSVALVGRTGSGKSTLAKLIPRLLDPAGGRITIDGVDIRDIALEELRSLIGFVPQETFLFSATLAQNIAFGVPGASEAEIHHAAKLAGLGTDIAGFPNGFDTVVGERGVLLSGGQKQRVAIARALVKNPRILIFDDALSSVDSVTEQRILAHLDSALKGRTTILITHRLASVRCASCVIVLEGGQIAERGTHPELLRGGGNYARLWRKHQLEEELETA